MALHLIRVLAAATVSTLTFAVLVWLAWHVSWVRDFTLFVAPVSIGIGYLPLWRWYPRDAYPIGLVYCPSMLLVLVYFHRWLEQWR